MTRDSEARDLWHSVYEHLTRSRPGTFGAVTSRAEAQVLRLSLLFALLDESKIVRRPHLEAAIALWRYAEESTQFIFGNSTGDPVVDQVFELVTNMPGISRTEIYKKFSRHISKDQLAHALATLQEDRLIHMCPENTAGRRKERWYPGTNLDMPITQASESPMPQVAVDAAQTQFEIDPEGAVSPVTREVRNL